MVITYTEKLQKGKIFLLLKIDIDFSNSDRSYSTKSSALSVEKYGLFGNPFSYCFKTNPTTTRKQRGEIINIYSVRLHRTEIMTSML